jgi:signal transduction histidine kinase
MCCLTYWQGARGAAQQEQAKEEARAVAVKNAAATSALQTKIDFQTTQLQSGVAAMLGAAQRCNDPEVKRILQAQAKQQNEFIAAYSHAHTQSTPTASENLSNQALRDWIASLVEHVKTASSAFRNEDMMLRHDWYADKFHLIPTREDQDMALAWYDPKRIDLTEREKTKFNGLRDETLVVQTELLKGLIPVPTEPPPNFKDVTSFGGLDAYVQQIRRSISNN